MDLQNSNDSLEHIIDAEQPTAVESEKKSPSSSIDTLELEISWSNINAYVPLKEPLSVKNVASKALCCLSSNNNGNLEQINDPKNVEEGASGSSGKMHILKNVSGRVRPGELLALLGASGAGKTTLMNILTGRLQRELEVSGDVRINNVLIPPKKIAALSAFIQQDDQFISSITVKEHLIFQAFLRMGQHVPTMERRKRVETVIADLSLRKCQDTRIGEPGLKKGISGGERKRLSIASEFLTNPSLLILDEPTSGLDSYMALAVVESLKNLVKMNKTVIAVVHQPSSEVFAQFDNLQLLSEGRVAFDGKLNDAIEFFRSIGYPCPPRYNPADFFIYTLAIKPGETEEGHKRSNHICDSFEERRLV